MPVLPPGYPDAASDVLTLVRAMMNENAVTAGVVWTDAKLLPFLASSYRALQRDLAVRNITVMEGESQIVLPTGGTKLTTTPAGSDAALPSDFIWPKRLYEQGNLTTEKFVPMSYAYEQIPQIDQSDLLQYWDYVGDEIRTLGATRDINVKLIYERALPKITAAADPLRIRDAVDCLAARTAGMAARSKGVQKLAADLFAEYEVETGKLAVRGSKWKQRYPVRRRPYGSRSRAPY